MYWVRYFSVFCFMLFLVLWESTLSLPWLQLHLLCTWLSILPFESCRLISPWLLLIVFIHFILFYLLFIIFNLEIISLAERGPQGAIISVILNNSLGSFSNRLYSFFQVPLLWLVATSLLKTTRNQFALWKTPLSISYNFTPSAALIRHVGWSRDTL